MKRPSRLRAGGWLDKGYFYIVDEPYSKDSFEQIDKHVARLKRLVPDYKLVAPYFRNPDFDEKLTVYDMLKGRVNIWCYNTLFYDREALEERARAGEVKDFTGISSPYEAPLNPELVIDTANQPLADCVMQVLDYLRGRGLLPADR